MPHVRLALCIPCHEGVNDKLASLIWLLASGVPREAELRVSATRNSVPKLCLARTSGAARTDTQLLTLQQNIAQLAP